MHVIFRESHGLEDTEAPVDLGQSAADLVVLSFSDSDLGAFAAGWHRGREADAGFPTLRLANLASLKHPLSVDTYVENTLVGRQSHPDPVDRRHALLVLWLAAGRGTGPVERHRARGIAG